MQSGGRDYNANIIHVRSSPDIGDIAQANSRSKVGLFRHKTYEYYVREIKYDTLKLFIFDYAKIVSMNPDKEKKEIPFDSVFLQRYDLTIKNLDALNWTLSFPPDDRMKDMKMYPAYDSEK
jgi:hypothetical protein